MLYGLALSYLYRTPPGGEAQGLGPAGLALLGPRGPFPAGPRTLLLYDAAKKPHASVSCGADGLQLLPPAPQSGYVTLQVGGTSADGGAPPTTWSLLLRDPGTEWEPLARAMAVARATSSAHGAATGAGGPPAVVVQDVALGDGGPRRDDVAALGDVCEVSYTMYAPPGGQTEDGDGFWASPAETHTRALVALTAAQGPHVAPRGMLEGLTGCAAGGRRLVLVPWAAVCAGPELLAVSAHAQGLLMYDVTLHTARAVLPSTQAEEQAGGVAQQQQAPPPPPPPQPVTPVEDPRQALVQRMARLASQTGGQMPLPTLPVSRPQSPVDREWEEGHAVSAGGQPPLAAVAPQAWAQQQQAGGDTTQEPPSNGHHAHDVHPAMQSAPPAQQQQQQQQHVPGPPPHAYMPSTPTPMPVHPQAHGGDGGMSHGHGGGQQAPSSAWGATPPTGMHHAAQQQSTHHEQQQQQMQQQSMLSPMLAGMGGAAGVGNWPGHASPGLMYGAPMQHVPMAMPMAAQPPWALPQLYHHPASPAYGSGPAAMYYAAAQGDALARLHAVTEHLARSVDSMLLRPLPYSLSHPPPANVASLSASSLVPPVSPALSTATTRVTRVAAERDAADAQRRALAAERDAAEDERDAALAQLAELRLHLAHAQEQVQALQREQSSAAETAGTDVAAIKAELAGAQRQASQLAEELQAAAQAHREAEQAWQQERRELETTCGAWERTAEELQASCEALRRELAAEKGRHHQARQGASEATGGGAMRPSPQAEAAALVPAEDAEGPKVAEVEVEEAPAAEATEHAIASGELPRDIEEPVAAVPAADEVVPSLAAPDGAQLSAPAEEAVAEDAAEAAADTRAASPEPAWEDASETPTAQVAASPVIDAAPEVAPEVQETAAVAEALSTESDAGEPQPSDGAVASIPAAGGPKPTQRPRGAGGRRLPSTAPPPQQQPAQQVGVVSTGTAAAKPSRRKTIFDDSDDDGGDVASGAPPPRPALPPPPPRPAGPDDDDNDGW